MAIRFRYPTVMARLTSRARAITAVRERAAAGDLIGAVGLAALVVGLSILPPQLTFEPAGAARGVLSQLAVTAPSALFLTLAATANIVVAAQLVRSFIPSVGGSLPAFVLVGWGGAVLLDVGLLYLLGWAGLFTWPVLVAVHGALLALAWARGVRRPAMTGVRARFNLAWVLVAIVWAAPVALQLASPVVPFTDVLPNHVAPVEHVRTFGQFDPLTTSPSPIYGPSRLSLGYIGLLGTVTTMSGVPAAQSVSAFIAVEVVIVGVAVAALARAAVGRHAVWWALVAFALTQPFARLADDRSRVLALALATWALVELLRASRRHRPRHSVHWPLALAVGATLLMHAVVGALLWLALLFLVIALPARYRLALPALAAGGILALPQAAVMLGTDVPGVIAAVTFPTATGAALMVARPAVQDALLCVARPVVIGAAAVALLGALVAGGFANWVADFGARVPLLGMAGLAGVAGFATFRPGGRAVMVALLAAGGLAGALALAVPADTDALGWGEIRFEVPKEVHSWVPLGLAIGAAALLAPLPAHVRSPFRRAAAARLTVGLVAITVAALPLRQEPIGPLHVGERHLAENLAIQLRYAQDGFWVGYPDSRWVVDAEGREVLRVIQAEVARGRISAESRLLHLAASYQQWAAIPVGVFTGVIETVLSPATEVSPQGVGSRLIPTEDSALHLAAAYDYILVEPGSGIELDDAVTARYEVIFTSARATLLRCIGC